MFNAATIIGEMDQEQKIDAAKLVAVAPAYRLAVVRRLAWLLDRNAEFVDTSALSDVLHEFVGPHLAQGRRPVDLLQVGGPRRGKADAKWGVVVNIDVAGPVIPRSVIQSRAVQKPWPTFHAVEQDLVLARLIAEHPLLGDSHSM